MLSVLNKVNPHLDRVFLPIKQGSRFFQGARKIQTGIARAGLTSGFFEVGTVAKIAAVQVLGTLSMTGGTAKSSS